MTANEVRQQIIAQMSRWGFTPEMCANKSADMLLHIAAMMVSHRRYQGVLEADEIVRLGKLEETVRLIS